MREIEFRAWSKKYKMYINDMFIRTDGVLFDDVPDTQNNPNKEIGMVDSEGFILEQYTGLRDVHGTKIYEGDIVGFTDYSNTESGAWERSCIGQVVWGDDTAGFCVTNTLSAEPYEVLGECVVLGNINQDIELLEGNNGE